jgi:hypothetical protein
VRVCKLAGNACARAPSLAVIEGDKGGVTLMPDGYAAQWKIGDTLSAGQKLRIAIELDALALASIDIEVTSDGRQLRTMLVNELVSNTNRSLPINFWVGRTPQIATRALHAAGNPASEIAQVLKTEFALTATEVASLLASDNPPSVDAGTAMKVMFELAAQPTAVTTSASK